MLDVGSLMHQRSSWAQIRAQAYTSSCYQEYWVCSQKIMISLCCLGNTVIFTHFSCSTASFFSVVPRGGLFCLCAVVFWQVLRQKHAQDATSDLNDFSKTATNFVDQRLSLHSAKGSTFIFFYIFNVTYESVRD